MTVDGIAMLILAGAAALLFAAGLVTGSYLAARYEMRERRIREDRIRRYYQRGSHYRA